MTRCGGCRRTTAGWAGSCAGGRSSRRGRSALSSRCPNTAVYQVQSPRQVCGREVASLQAALASLSTQYNQLKVASAGLVSESEEMRAAGRRREEDARQAELLNEELTRELADLAVRHRNIEAERRATETKLNQTLPQLVVS